jgi:hypothetical protein
MKNSKLRPRKNARIDRLGNICATVVRIATSDLAYAGRHNGGAQMFKDCRLQCNAAQERHL